MRRRGWGMRCRRRRGLLRRDVRRHRAGALLPGPGRPLHGRDLRRVLPGDLRQHDLDLSAVLPLGSPVDFTHDALPALGRLGMGGAFLASAEHRSLQVARLYKNLLKRPAPPVVKNQVWVRNGIDRFLLS